MCTGKSGKESVPETTCESAVCGLGEQNSGLNEEDIELGSDIVSTYTEELTLSDTERVDLTL